MLSLSPSAGSTSLVWSYLPDLTLPPRSGQVLGALLDAAFGDVLAKMHSNSTEAEVLASVADVMKQRLGEKAEQHKVGAHPDAHPDARARHPAHATPRTPHGPCPEPRDSCARPRMHQGDHASPVRAAFAGSVGPSLDVLACCRGAALADAVAEDLSVAEHYSVYLVQRVWRERARRRAPQRALAC